MNVWVEESGQWDGTRGDPTKPFSNIGRAFAAAQPGDVIRIGPGRFQRTFLDQQMSKSLTIIGSGMHSTVLETDHVSTNPGEIYTLLGSHLPVMGAGTRLEIRDLTINCNGQPNIAAGSRQQGLQAVAEDIYLSRIRVCGCVADGYGNEVFGIAAHGKRIWVEDCQVENNNRAYLTGIMVGGGRGWNGTDSVIVRGCVVYGFSHTHSIGLGMASANNVTAYGNMFHNVTRGIMCDTGGVRNVLASGNIMRGVPGSFGVYLAHFDAINVRISGNIIEDFDCGVYVSRWSAEKKNKAQRIDGLAYRDNSFVGCKKTFARN